MILSDACISTDRIDYYRPSSAVFSDFIVEHPYVRRNPKLRALADDLGDRLADFYQAVGAETSAEDGRHQGRKRGAK